MRQAGSRSEGFSLLEVTVAIAILAIAIASLIHLFSLNLRGTVKSELYTEGTIIARSILDEALSRENLQEESILERSDEVFRATRTVTALPMGEKDVTKAYEVSVRVEFKGGSVEFRARKSVSNPK